MFGSTIQNTKANQVPNANLLIRLQLRWPGNLFGNVAKLVLFSLTACCLAPAFAQTNEESTIWKRHIIDDSSQGADGIRLADFDRDGRLDIVTGWEEGGITRVYFQPPVNEVRDRWPAVTVGKAKSVEDAVAVDLDADGALDVISSTEGRTRTLFVHWAPTDKERVLDPRQWKTEAIPSSIGKQAWMFCVPMQIDGKRGIDLVTGSKNPNGAVGWWESPEDPRNLADWKYHKLADAGWVMSIFARDVDLDGDVDLIYSDRKTERRGLKWLEAPATTTIASHPNTPWKTHIIGLLDREILFGVMHDLDSDGSEDIINATRNGVIDIMRRMPGKSTRGSAPPWQRYSIANPFGFEHGKSVAVADFNRDGKLDIATTQRSQPVDGPAVAILEHSGDPWSGKWTAKDIGGPDGSKFDLIEAIDLDRDGDLDLLTCEEVSNLGVFWYENPTF